MPTVIIVRVPGAQQMLKGASEFYWNSLESAIVTRQVRVWGQERNVNYTYIDPGFTSLSSTEMK